MDALGNHALAVEVEERVRELMRWRRWYRNQPDPARWADLAAEHEAELRTLLRCWNRAHRISRQAHRLMADGDHFAGIAS